MALESIVSEVDLDVYDHDQIVPNIKAIGRDSVVRYVRANLFKSGEAYEIDDENVVVKLHALRPDRTLVIGPATYNVERVMISPEYTPVREEVIEEVYERYYYVNDDNQHVYIDDPEDAPEGYEVMTEPVGGGAYYRWYYIDENDNKIYVASGDVIPAVYSVSYELYAEMTKEMLDIPGITKMQFKITSGNQELRTSIFNVNVGENLENKGACNIDLTAE